MPTEAPEKTVTAYWFQDATLTAVDEGKRYIIMLCGTGSGKTWWIPAWLSYLIMRDHEAGNGKGARYLAIGCTGDMVNDMILPEIEERFRDTELEGHYHISGRRYELPTGGNIYMRSAEKPYRIEGHHVRGAVLDEPSEMKSLIWPIIMRRTAFYEAPVLFTGYPTNMGWYYENLYVPWTKGADNIVVIEAPSTANPEYPREEFDNAKATLPTWLFEMAYLGKFRKPFGLVYPDFGDHLYVDPFEIPDDWPTYAIVDPAVHYGGLFMAWNRGTYYVYDEYYEEEVKSAREYAEAMLAKIEGINQGWLYDPARLTDVVNLMTYEECPECGEELHTESYPYICPHCSSRIARPLQCGSFYKSMNAVRPGIITVTGIIKSGRLKVMRGKCPVFVDQMAKYRWQTDPVTGKVVDNAEKPIKKNDDLPDCLRYALHTLESAPLEERGVMGVDLDEEISPY